MGIRTFLLTLLAMLVATQTALAQDTRDLNRSGRGRLPDSGARLEAQALADRAGLTCRVVNAVALGRDIDGNRQFEVACEEGRGYRLIAGAGVEALDCLVLATADRASGVGEAVGRACRLPENRDSSAAFARLASDAGLTCPVDAGAVVGRSQDGGTVYEIGCAGAAGAWIEQAGADWRVTDCLVVEAQGNACRFTTPAEQLAGFAARLPTGAISGCSPTQVRFMGRSPTAAYYEVQCQTGAGAVAAFGPGGEYRETIACPDARLIGDGCQLATGPSSRGD
ncbi:MAG: hypothetical protein IM674_09790 [Brevundimonas sp.]|jgi:hypothetical protein|nr:hypothetical protein [Brevundimonas sp.]MCA3718531.1 hypothetical protein [Brevundimonas sp.]